MHMMKISENISNKTFKKFTNHSIKFIPICINSQSYVEISTHFRRHNICSDATVQYIQINRRNTSIGEIQFIPLSLFISPQLQKFIDYIIQFFTSSIVEQNRCMSSRSTSCNIDSPCCFFCVIYF